MVPQVRPLTIFKILFVCRVGDRFISPLLIHSLHTKITPLVISSVSYALITKHIRFWLNTLSRELNLLMTECTDTFQNGHFPRSLLEVQSNFFALMFTTKTLSKFLELKPSRWPRPLIFLCLRFAQI